MAEGTAGVADVVTGIMGDIVDGDADIMADADIMVAAGMAGDVGMVAGMVPGGVGAMGDVCEFTG